MEYPILNELDLLAKIKQDDNLLKKIVEENKDKIKEMLLTNNNYEIEEKLKSEIEEKLKSEYKEKLKEIEEEKEQLSNKEKEIQEEKEQLSNKKNILENLEKVNKQKSTPSSYSIGEFNELLLKNCLSDDLVFQDNWDIDINKKMNCMDIRLINKKAENIIIGIECKHKQVINMSDIDKFNRDKIKNKFMGNIFVSNRRIPNYVEEINSFKLVGNDLYICSEDIYSIKNLIILYIQQISINNNKENRKEDDTDNLLEFTDAQYKLHQLAKKNIKKIDEFYIQKFKQILNEKDFKKLLGQNFFILKKGEINKHKKNKIDNPYEIIN